MSRRLPSGIPRAWPSHHGPEAAAYRAYTLSIIHRLFGADVDAQTLPADWLVTLREAGRLTVELQASGRELDAAKAARRRRDVARLRRQMIPMRTQLLALERRLEELAKARRPNLSDLLRTPSD